MHLKSDIFPAVLSVDIKKLAPRTFGRSLPPHPGPLPRGEGEPFGANDRKMSAGKFSDALRVRCFCFE